MDILEGYSQQDKLISKLLSWYDYYYYNYYFLSNLLFKCQM